MVDEAKLKVSEFTFLEWMERFPSWHLTASPIPPTPPPPGVATRKAAAIAENKDPDKAVSEAQDKVIIEVILQPYVWSLLMEGKHVFCTA